MMVEKLVENEILFYCAGIAIFLGFIIKVIVGISLKRLIKAASNMSKSNHSLMRLVRAKFEHACMVSDKVQNVAAFVEKYLYEYKILGIPLHTLSQLEKTMIWLCGILSIAGGALSYYRNYDIVMAQSYAVLGGVGVLFLILLQVTMTEKGKLDAAKMYMVDFLENTYAHRYEKNIRRENVEESKVQERVEVPQNEVVVEPQAQMSTQKSAEPQVQIAKSEPLEAKEQNEKSGQAVMRPAFSQAEQEPELQPVQADKIREILEEFLA